MRTLVVSDLHLGRGRRVDLLRQRALREPLLAALEGVDRLVLLGDALELREGSQRAIGQVAEPFFADVGRALGPDRELLVAPGNHDHGLVAGWVDGRLQTEAPGFLGLETRLAPQEAGPLASRLAEAARPARVGFAYPGVWLREDVYATHGHYSDVHTTVPTIERLAAGAMAHWMAGHPPERARPDHYEAVLSPLYAWLHAVAQRADGGRAPGSGPSTRAWSLLAGEGRRRRPVRAAALATGYVLGVAAVNRLGLGPVDRTLSGEALRRGGLHGISEVLRRLGVDAAHVVFGHTHRSGPWPSDDAREWTTGAGTRLWNTGSWVYQPHFLGGRPNQSPYWPGTAVVLDDGAPPRLLRLLGDRGHAELAAASSGPARAESGAPLIPAQAPPLA